jgi:hypothetical protein
MNEINQTALRYQSLIWRSYQTTNSEKHGASPEIYRKMVLAESLFNTDRSAPDAFDNFVQTILEIRMHITAALYAALQNHRLNDMVAIRNINSLILENKQASKSTEFNHIISQAITLFDKYNLQ